MPTHAKPELTEKQQAVYNALLEDDRMSIEEIARQTDSSTQTVFAALDVLESHKLITREPRKARSIRVVEARI